MDRKYHEKQAMKFNKEAYCYIHVEMKDGKAAQCVSGDGKALLHCLSKVIEQISKNTNNSYSTTLATLKAWHDLCEEEKKEGRYKK